MFIKRHSFHGHIGLVLSDHLSVEKAQIQSLSSYFSNTHTHTHIYIYIYIYIYNRRNYSNLKHTIFLFIPITPVQDIFNVEYIIADFLAVFHVESKN